MAVATSSAGMFPRNFAEEYPIAVRGEGVYIYDEGGNKYLDACGGAAVVSIGHGVGEVVDAIASQAQRLSYAHSSQFHTVVGAELATLLASKFPGTSRNARVHFTSGGSEATETAIKIVLQYWIARQQPSRRTLVSRWHGYHGTTLGALAVSGNRTRRRAYESLLAGVQHISPCFCYHCWLHKKYPECELACARELEPLAKQTSSNGDNVAAFFFEPVVGATSGATPPDDYLGEIQRICRESGVLLVADEVMTGAGRTGKYFAVEHWGITPDIILLGKGLTSGYAPLGAVLVAEHVWRTIADAGLTLQHGFTYQAHPPSVAAGLAVQRYLEKHNLVECSRDMGEYLAQQLESLRGHSCIGDIRGKGLLRVVEFVEDIATRRPFAADKKFGKRVFAELRSRGVLVYPGSGTVDGEAGDHVLIAPPFTIGKSEVDLLVRQMAEAASAVLQQVHSNT